MRILAVKTHAFGDALLTTPAVSALVRQGHKVSVVAGPSSLPVWSRFPGLESVIYSPFPCSPVRLILWSLKNRQKGFEKAIHFGSSHSAMRWTEFIGRCPVISGADPSVGFGRVQPSAADYCRIAGVEPGSLKPVFSVTPAERKFAEEIAGGCRYAVIAPGGGKNPREFVPEKRWPVERWSSVIRYLLEKGLKVFAVGGRDEAAELSVLPCESLAGKLTWGQSAALIAEAVIFSGNDSGPAHLAVASDTEAVVLFGPTDPDSLYVKGTVHAVRSTAACSPCYSNSVFPGCSNRSSCMSCISTEDVLKTIREILSR